MRRKAERTLKDIGKRAGYGAKLAVCSKNKLAKYIIFTKGKVFSGNYYSLNRRLFWIIAENRKRANIE